MKIFLKTLGFIFSFVIAGLVAVILFLIFCNWDTTMAVQILSERTYDTCVAVLGCMGLAILLAFCPTWFAINEAINNHFD